jgi:dipeptidyl aminopeptidase/acylaminoacyl peptidase
MPLTRRLTTLRFAALCALSAVLTVAAPAQRFGASGPAAVDIAPDGTTVAWIMRGRGGSTLHLNSVADPSKDQIVSVPGSAADCANSSPVWSPDGQTLAFTSTCAQNGVQAAPHPSSEPITQPGRAGPNANQEQIFLWSKSTGQVHQLTHLVGLFKEADWSPDGKTLAFLFVQNASRSAGALDAMEPWAGVIGEDHLEIQGIYGVDVATGNAGWLVPPTPAMYAFEFDWAPDSHHLAFVGAPAPGENNWWVAHIYTQDTAPGSSAVSIVDTKTLPGPLHDLQVAVPRYSPDGKRIAFIGGLMSDQGSTGGDIWVVDAQPGATPVDVTPGIDGTPCFEGWFDDHSVGFVEDRRGHTRLIAWDVTKKDVLPDPSDDVDLGEVTVSGGAIKDAVSFSGKTDTAAFVMAGVDHPSEIWFETAGKLRQFTHLSADQKPGPQFKSVEWQNEGFHVQGWLTYPANFDPSKKYPLIVEVHGGPSSSAGPRPNTMWSQQGYFVLAPNPRGSYGQGETFVQANRKDFGYGDLRDILKGVDTVEAMAPIDKHREGLTGWSYGGFMSMFASTQTGRFRAIVAGAGISDWESYYGENSIDQWMIPFFGASVYNDPAVYAKSSAITFIKKAAEYKTPMLIIVGDRDGECPAPQSFEMWHALRALGVTTQLVVYPNEGHGFRNPAHIQDRNERDIAWFAKYMPEE